MRCWLVLWLCASVSAKGCSEYLAMEVGSLTSFREVKSTRDNSFSTQLSVATASLKTASV